MYGNMWQLIKKIILNKNFKNFILNPLKILIKTILSMKKTKSLLINLGKKCDKKIEKRIYQKLKIRKKSPYCNIIKQNFALNKVIM